jgi:hypothetical protein
MLLKLECGHYVHNHKPNSINKEMKLFINKLYINKRKR